MVSSCRAIACAALLSMAVLYSGGPSMAQQAMVLPVDSAPLVADTGTEKKQFSVEIADDGEERARGLMFRQNMAPDHGMLFVFGEEQPLAFWMKNTILPLDLVFIDAKGKIVGVKQGTPYSEAPISPGIPSRFVLELNAGTAAKFGIDAGDIVHHPTIDKAAGAAN